MQTENTQNLPGPLPRAVTLPVLEVLSRSVIHRLSSAPPFLFPALKKRLQKLWIHVLSWVFRKQVQVFCARERL